ncbi:hypothetical protein GCM10010988_36330 [Cnuibacter physcomitrellae]|nr:hypothetical protein GCM10010988_36330 [Cnuibacter physcomitrellae]
MPDPTHPAPARHPLTLRVLAGLPGADTIRHYARILYMTTLSLADARAGFSRLIESANSTHERFEVTRNGRRMAILLSADDYDGLLETIDVLSDQPGVQALHVALEELQVGDVHSVDDVREAMAHRRTASE